MSKKHLVALAALLASLRPGGANRYATASERHKAEGAYAQWADTVKVLARWLAAQNPRFDRPRFLHACGMSVPVKDTGETRNTLFKEEVE